MCLFVCIFVACSCKLNVFVGFHLHINSYILWMWIGYIIHGLWFEIYVNIYSVWYPFCTLIMSCLVLPCQMFLLVFRFTFMLYSFNIFLFLVLVAWWCCQQRISTCSKLWYGMLFLFSHINTLKGESLSSKTTGFSGNINNFTIFPSILCKENYMYWGNFIQFRIYCLLFDCGH